MQIKFYWVQLKTLYIYTLTKNYLDQRKNIFNQQQHFELNINIIDFRNYYKILSKFDLRIFIF